MDESKLVFFTGAPGSKWSSVAHVIAQSRKYKFDTGDYAEDREYRHINNPKLAPHRGSYFGPGFPFGDSFDRVARLPKEEVYAEIEDAWITQNGGYKIIKCHQFSIDLEDIKREFPTSKIMIVWRNDKACADGWFGAGGFDITYPLYKEAYVNKEIMLQRIKKENEHNLRFIHQNKLEMTLAHEGHFKNFWDIDTEDPKIIGYIRMCEGITDVKRYNPTMLQDHFRYDTFISQIGFD